MIKPQQSTMECPSCQELKGHSYQQTIIGLFTMCLSTLVGHALILNSSPSFESSTSSSRLAPTPQRQIPGALAIGAAIVTMCAWVCGFFVWFLSFGQEPRRITARNRSLIYGLGAAIVSLTLMLLLRPGLEGQMFFGVTVWPVYFGLAIGSLL